MNQKPWNLASNCQQKVKTMILIHCVERLKQSWPTTLLKSLPVMGNLREIFQELKKKQFSLQEMPLAGLFFQLTSDANTPLVCGSFFLILPT